MTARVWVVAGTAVFVLGLAGCGKDEIVETCENDEPYRTVVDGRRIEVPDGLDPLDRLKEMPIPKAESPPRTEESRCLETPPSVLVGDG